MAKVILRSFLHLRVVSLLEEMEEDVKTDLNGDGHPDYVISINNGELLSFVRETDAKPPNQLILKGSSGNPLATGARGHLNLIAQRTLFVQRKYIKEVDIFLNPSNTIYFSLNMTL